MNSEMKTFMAVAVAALTCAGTASAISIVNGDFESGPILFSTDYTYATGANSLWPEGTYTVDTNPVDVHNLWYNMGDHTSGSGNMLIVNGDTTGGKIVWQGDTDVALEVGKQYDFSAYVASIYSANAASLSFTVQLLAGDTLLATLSPTLDGNWSELYASFTATAATTGPFKLLNANTVASGNDFAVDDINVLLSSERVPDGGVTAILLATSFLGLASLKRKINI